MLSCCGEHVLPDRAVEVSPKTEGTLWWLHLILCTLGTVHAAELVLREPSSQCDTALESPGVPDGLRKGRLPSNGSHSEEVQLQNSQRLREWGDDCRASQHCCT